MKFDSGTMIQNPSEGGPIFKALEDAGFDGAYTWEGAHDPFLPLVTAAMSGLLAAIFTKTLEGNSAPAFQPCRGPSGADRGKIVKLSAGICVWRTLNLSSSASQPPLLGCRVKILAFEKL